MSGIASPPPAYSCRYRTPCIPDVIILADSPDYWASVPGGSKGKSS
jgi:hypothetical protein